MLHTSSERCYVVFFQKNESRIIERPEFCWYLSLRVLKTKKQGKYCKNYIPNDIINAVYDRIDGNQLKMVYSNNSKKYALRVIFQT